MFPDTDSKRDAILKATLELVAERGFHDTPMSQVAKRSGASPGVIYHYFASKDELIRDLYREVKAVKARAMLQGGVDGVSPKEAFKRTWRNAYDFYRTHRLEARFLEQYENSPYHCPTDLQELAKEDQNFAVLARRLGFVDGGNPFKPLPTDIVYDLSFGVAARLARRAPDEPLDDATLDDIAEGCWRAIARNP
ncbi:TetR/AcrR family transcriptional regulator [Inquilinus sp. NPDC058860]|uniref:TetR/AcrR family transcriptional regulator n=1 Tax=Inquilinus sp. NPDC058860 TaxID=3346652 RepID=UPI0036B4D31C